MRVDQHLPLLTALSGPVSLCSAAARAWSGWSADHGDAGVKEEAGWDGRCGLLSLARRAAEVCDRGSHGTSSPCHPSSWAIRSAMRGGGSQSKSGSLCELAGSDTSKDYLRSASQAVSLLCGRNQRLPHPQCGVYRTFVSLGSATSVVAQLMDGGHAVSCMLGSGYLGLLLPSAGGGASCFFCICTVYSFF